MPTDRVLIEIVTAANMAGIEQAKTGMLGLNASTLGLAASLGVLVLAGKSAIENTEKMQKAQLSLRQAAAATGKNFDELQSQFSDWAQANKRYIADQYDAEAALAAFVRAGNSEKDSMRLINDALDLSVIKHESVSEAGAALEKVLSGNSKALKEFGITTDEYNSIMHNKLLSTEQKHLALMALIESKTKDGRKAQTDLQLSTQALNKDWQDLSTKAGPVVLQALGMIVQGIDDAYGAMVAFSKDDAAWGSISAHLTDLATKARDLALYLGIAGTSKLSTALADRGADRGGQGLPPPTATSKTITAYPGGSVYTGHGSFDEGGVVPGPPGSVQVIQARGGEQYMGYGSGRQGGSDQPIVIHNHLHLDGHQIDLVTNVILRRGGYAPGR